MDYKKTKAPTNTVTRNIMDLCDDTNNIYESVVSCFGAQVVFILSRIAEVDIVMQEFVRSNQCRLWQFLVIT